MILIERQRKDGFPGLISQSRYLCRYRSGTTGIVLQYSPFPVSFS